MRVVIGRVGRAHGIRGDVSVAPRTDEPEEFFVAGAVLSTDPATAGPLTVDSVRWHSGRLLVAFAGVADRTAAEGLRGVLLEAERPDGQRPTGPDEYYDHELVGLAVVTVTGDAVGEVAEVVHLPGQDLLAVRRADRPEALIPFVRELVPDIDLGLGRVTVDPPPGLLDLQEPGAADPATATDEPDGPDEPAGA